MNPVSVDRLERIQCPIQPGFVAGKKSHLRSFVEQRPDGGKADPRRSAGHHRDPVGKSQIHV